MYNTIVYAIICQNANRTVPKSVDTNCRQNTVLAMNAAKPNEINAKVNAAWTNRIKKPVSSFAGHKLSHVSIRRFVANGLLLNVEIKTKFD